MELYVCRKYFRAPKNLQKTLVGASVTLYDRIKTYEGNNISFDRILTDDKIKHDKHGQFFTYKTQRDNLQIRILYAYTLINGTATILIADFSIKKKHNKEYIREFDAMNNVSISDMYAKARYVYSC